MTRVGVDVGGTFTDVVTVEDGRLEGHKTPSTPGRPDDGVFDGLADAETRGVDVTGADFLGHGTTVATNAVLEDELARTALVTTEGFRDVLEIGRQDRPDLYDLDFERPTPLVPRDLRFTVPERVGPDGAVVEPLADEDVTDLAGAIPDDVDAVAVATLFAFADPSHERQIGTALRDERDVPVSLSSAVLGEFREYERTATTALNAALRPVMETYLDRLAERAREAGIDREWLVMQSDGGLTGAAAAAEQPVRTVLSGPAAGVRGAQYVASRAGYEDLLTMDMGGTSTDVSLVVDGEPSRTTDWAVGGRPLGVPAVDVHTVGAGGGSVARVDEGGALRVGPASAGADPGPAAYGRGGQRATVTDAHVVLGRIHPDHPIGGVAVDVEAAEAAVERTIADPLDRSVAAAARGILAVARANMERALRVVSVEQGHDPRSLALVAFGGAGPLHAPRLAADLSIPTVLIPRLAGVLSALGLLAADLEHSYSRSVVAPLSDVDPRAVAARADDLASQGRDRLADEGVDAERIRVERALDLRYEGQSYSITVPLDGEITADALATARDRFHGRHESQYGHADPSEPVELVTVRVRAVGDIEPVDASVAVEGTVADARLGERAVAFDDRCRDVPVYDHGRLPPGGSFDGPAVVQADASTTVVQPGQSVTVDARGTLEIATGVEGER